MAGPEEGREHGSSQTRHRLLELLRATDRGLHPLELAARLDLHVNTVHRHLEVLEGAGVVVRQPEDRNRPGRPRVVYTVVDEHANGCLGHRFLARALVAYVNATTDPVHGGREAGETWGRYLADARPFAHTDPTTGMQKVADLLNGLGFEAQASPEDRTLSMVGCPYPELVDEYPDLLCNLHIGLVDGALQAYGSPLTVVGHQPRTADSPCVFRLAEG